MNKKNKNSIYDLFNILNECGRTKEEILTLQKIKAPTFHKNLQKLKLAGFKIEKRDNVYHLEKYKNILSLDENEKSAIAYMLNIARKNFPEFKYISFQNFVKKFLIMASDKDHREIIKKFQLIKKYSLIEEYKEKIEKFERHIKEKETLKITLKSNKSLKIVPLRCSESRKRIFLNYKNIIKNEEEKVSIENIIKIEKYSERDYIESEGEIIFELYGSLAERYLLKQNERVVKNKKDSIVIAINTKDRDALFQRLLRYDTLCKILFPKSDVEAFKKLIDKAIINIDSIQGEDE